MIDLHVDSIRGDLDGCTSAISTLTDDIEVFKRNTENVVDNISHRHMPKFAGVIEDINKTLDSLAIDDAIALVEYVNQAIDVLEETDIELGS